MTSNTACKPGSIHLKGKLTFGIVQAQGFNSFCEIGRWTVGNGKDTGLLQLDTCHSDTYSRFSYSTPMTAHITVKTILFCR